MAGELHDLRQLLGKADLGVACRDCRHHDTLAIATLLMTFAQRRWLTDWRAAHVRFRCSRCGSKNVTLNADFANHGRTRRLSGQDALRPDLRPPPPGVSIAEWNAADERERRRLVTRSRS